MSKRTALPIYILSSLISLLIGVVGCESSRQKQSIQAEETSQAIELDERATVVLNPVYLKTGSDVKSEILPLHFEFLVQEQTKAYVEDQMDEIKRILIVYFADKNPEEIKKTKADFLPDQILTATINDFLKSGHIQASKYKVSTEVL